jgi:hypothetical protein
MPRWTAIDDDSFDMIIEAVKESEGDINSVRQACIGRSFTAHQALIVLETIKAYSPFDLIEAACLMCTHLLNRESLQLVLNVFDRSDRENICLRCNIPTDESVLSSTSSGIIHPTRRLSSGGTSPSSPPPPTSPPPPLDTASG